jgi:hypothetical protein
MSDAAAHATITLAQSKQLPGSADGQADAATAAPSTQRIPTSEQPTPLPTTGD